MQAMTQAQILEVDNYYSAISLEIFDDDSRTHLRSMEVVVQRFKVILEVVPFENNVWHIFKVKETLKELDSKTKDFVEGKWSGIFIEKWEENIKSLIY